MKKNTNPNIKQAILKYIKSNKEINKHFNFTYHTQKHRLEDMLNEIIPIIKFAIPWRETISVSFNSAYDTYKRLIKFGVLKKTYMELLKKYFIKTPANKLKLIYTDTTCVVNKYGSELVKYNGYKKRKVTKISLITDSLGIPINIKIGGGTEDDGKIFIKQIRENDWLINDELIEKYKKCLLADSGYDQNKLRTILNNKNYKQIIAYNNRKTKDILKIKNLTTQEKDIYVKRIKIEHMNGLLKSHRRIQTRYDRKVNTFENSIYLACIEKLLNFM